MGLAGDVIRAARLRAGLSQRALASRVPTSQSLVARWERGAVEPSLATVQRVAEACGLELRVGLAEADDADDALAAVFAELGPEERLETMARAAALRQGAKGGSSR